GPTAALTGGTAGATPAGDLQLGLALDDPPPGWRVANPHAAKAITAALLAGENVELVIEAAEPDCEWLRRAPFVCRGGSQTRPSIDCTTPAVVVTDLAGPTGDARLVLHPATLAVGVGCERGVAAAEVADLVRRCLAEATLAVGAVAGIYSIALKAAEPAIHAVADKLGVPARFF